MVKIQIQISPPSLKKFYQNYKRVFV